MTPITANDNDAMVRLVRRYGDAWNSHDLDAIMSMHTRDTVFQLHLLDAPEITGLDAVREAFAGFLALWPDIHFGSERLHIGDGFFVHHCTVTGTLAAPLPFGSLVAQPTGSPIGFTGVDVITVEDGLVRRKDTYLDIAAAQQRLGVLGEPATAGR